MSPRWPIVGAWTLALASAGFWAYTLAHPRTAAAPAQPPLAAPSGAGDLTRLLGADAPPPMPMQEAAAAPVDAQLQLLGVLSPAPDAEGDAAEGLALIAVNGQPAKVYRVGMAVHGDLVLQAVEAKAARLGPAGAAPSMVLQTTTLPAAGAAGAEAGGNPALAAAAAPALPMPAPPTAAPAVMPPPAAAPVAGPDGAPPPFGGPPQAFGGAPPAQPQGAGARRPVSR